MHNNLFYLFIISSLNHPVYRQVHKRRKPLLEKYNIPYTVLLNDQESSLSDSSSHTLIPTEKDELLYNGGDMNPFMAQKFLFAVKMYFRSFKTYEEIPTYIVRINATVFVHFPSMIKALQSPETPKERAVIGPFWGDVFVQGMVMIFTKDVLMNMLNDPNMFSKEIMKLNDDVSLSFLSKPHSSWHSWDRYMVWPSENNTMDGMYMMHKIDTNAQWMFRICHWTDRSVDLKNWDLLVSYYESNNVKPQEIMLEDAKPYIYFIITLILLIVVFVVFLAYNAKLKPTLGKTPISTKYEGSNY